MRLCILCILLLLLTAEVWSQPYTYTSAPNGYFTIDQIKGCAPLTVNIYSTACSGGCDADYIGDGKNYYSYPGVKTGYTYTDPGIYTIVFVKGAGANNIDKIQVEVVANVE